MTDQQFTKRKGMSYCLKKKKAECSDEEKEYKLQYSRWIKGRYIKKKSPERFHNYNSAYGKEYYKLHQEKLKDKARDRQRDRRDAQRTKSEESGVNSSEGRGASRAAALSKPRGRTNRSGIHIEM